MDVRGKKVYVGLSGGVDSAVSAALLKEAGAEVTGVFIKGWYPRGMPCTWAEDRRDAMRVAAHLHIPFRTLDASAEYKQGVIDYLLSEYGAGRTPNPDVMCNKEVKFGAFYRYAKADGADVIATGHYRAGEKDQTYFLWAVPAEILARTLFPVGSLEKGEVRKLAARFGLPVADKKDSQGVCFLGPVSIEEFLAHEFKVAPGIARDETGQVLGQHRGALLHTIGERVSLEGARPGPWYVLSKDIAKNELLVGTSRAPQTGTGGIQFTNALWQKNVPVSVEAQYRYRGPRIRGRIKEQCFLPDEALPEYPAPGQSIVFYESGALAGGAIITEVSAGTP